MRKIIAHALLIVISVAFFESGVCAGEDSTTGALTYFSAGMLIVDAGVSIGNGISLSSGKPNRLNGYLGVAAGAIYIGLIALNYATTGDRIECRIRSKCSTRFAVTYPPKIPGAVYTLERIKSYMHLL